MPLSRPESARPLDLDATPTPRRRRDLASLARRTGRILPLAAAMAFLPALPAPAQDAPTGVSVSRTGRVSLLPEGVVLEQAVGEVFLDEQTSMLVFSPRVSAEELARRLFILPGAVRSDLAAAIEALGESSGSGDDGETASRRAAVDCEITGRVFTYRGRNFLLATAAVSAAAPGEPSEASDASPEVAGVPPKDAVPSRLGDEDLAARLERELEAAVGGAPRSLDLGEASGEPTSPAAEERWHRRRGHFRRDLASGMLVFVPEADGTGVRDHPLEVLPCRLLERIERTISDPAQRPILRVSGVVIVEGPRRFLLPTSFERPREGRGIAP